MEYNYATNRLVVFGYSHESDFCDYGNMSCNFIIMFENDTLDIKWSVTFDGLKVSRSQSVAFSEDGSLIVVIMYNPYSINLMNALTGEIRASIYNENWLT